MGNQRYPSDAGVGGGTKGQLPCGLERLEELVGLEKGAQGQSVCEAEGQQQGQQKRRRRRRVTIAGSSSSRETLWWSSSSTSTSTSGGWMRVPCGVGGSGGRGRHWAIRSVQAEGEAKGRRTEGKGQSKRARQRQ